MRTRTCHFVLAALALLIVSSTGVAATAIAKVSPNSGVKKTRPFTLPISDRSKIYGLAYAWVDEIVSPGGESGKAPSTIGPTLRALDTDAAGNLAEAETRWQVTATPAIKVNDPEGNWSWARVNSKVRATAISMVNDPWIFQDTAGEVIEMEYTLYEGFGLQALGDASAIVTIDAATPFSDYGSLFWLNLDLNGLNRSELNVTFWSNPDLGLDDQLIEDSLLAALQFDPMNGSYYLGTDFTIATMAFDVPNDVNEVAFYWNVFGQVAVIPTPSTLVLMGVGGLLSVSRRQYS